MFRPGRSWELAATAVPVAMDVAHFLLFDALNRPLRRMLAEPSLSAVLTVLGLYLAFAISLFFVSRLRPSIALRTVVLQTRDDDGRTRATKTTWPQVLFAYPSLGFGVVMIMTVVTAAGMTATEGGLSEGWQQTAVGAAIVVFFIHLAGSMMDIEPRHASSEPGYFATLVPVVLISEVMLNLSVAMWHRYLGLDADGPAPTSPSVAGFVVAVPIFLLFFAAPRFTMMSRAFSWPSLASGLALALWELWQLLAEAPLL